MSIKRYDWTPDHMWSFLEGNYVKYADHEAEVAELNALWKQAQDVIKDDTRIITELENKLAVAVEALKKIDDRCDEPCSSWAVEALEKIERAGV